MGMENEEDGRNPYEDIEEMLRRANMNMSAREFYRLDPEVQNDIMRNCIIQDAAHQAPENSPYLQPIHQENDPQRQEVQELIREELEQNEQPQRMEEEEAQEDLRAGRIRENHQMEE